MATRNCVSPARGRKSVSGQSNGVGGVATGWTWQCVEYAARYYKAVYNLQIAGRSANTWYANAAAKGLRAFPNGGTSRPRVGDILCSAYSDGHVAIVREVGPNFVKVIHQNWSNTTADDSKRLTLTVTGGKYTVQPAGRFSFQGWLRK